MTQHDLRSYLLSHPPSWVATLARGPLDSVTEFGDHEIAHAIVCHCGSNEFRLLGVASAMAPASESARGRDRMEGGYVLRSMLRLWRELRMTAGEEVARSALVAPIVLACARCSARHELVAGDSARADSAPLEAHRCRPCRRTTFGVSVVHDYAALDFDGAAQVGVEERFEGWRIRVRCRVCGRTADPVRQCVRSAQQRTLDSLYGREDRSEVETPEEPHG